jgi:ribosome-associated translation inhibitor RaiA
MQFQLRTDNHIDNSEALAERVRAEVEGAVLPRFSEQMRRIEVYLQDMNSHKGGVDTRCAIEAHMAGLQPLAVDARAPSIDEAVSAAADKLLRLLEHHKGRLEDRGGRVSMSGEPT